MRAERSPGLFWKLGSNWHHKSLVTLALGAKERQKSVHGMHVTRCALFPAGQQQYLNVSIARV